MADNESNSKILMDFERFFLSSYPIKRIPWNNLQHIINLDTEKSYTAQAELIQSTYKHPLNQKQPVNLKYQYEFLKMLIDEFENRTSEIHDAFYEGVTEVALKLSSERHNRGHYVYKHFLLPSGSGISMKESPYFVSDGTTGLCTWPSSIALATYLLQHPEIVQGRRVLELGAGLGFCSLAIFKYCSPGATLVTDGSLSCLDHYAENININFPNIKRLSSQRVRQSGRTLEYCQVRWETIDESRQVSELRPDIVLGSDIIYESDTHDSIVKAFDYLRRLQRDNDVQFIFAFALRNENTTNAFLQLLESSNYEVQDLMVPAPGELFVWDDSTTIRIISIRFRKEEERR